MVVANVPYSVDRGGYLSVQESVVDRLESTYGRAPEASIGFAGRKSFPVVRFRSAMKWEDSERLLLFLYDIHSVTDLDKVPPGMKQNGELIPTSGNIASLLEDEAATKTIQILLYDENHKTQGKELKFYIWGQDKLIVQAYYIKHIKKSEVDKEKLCKTLERAAGEQIVFDPTLELLAPGREGSGVLYPKVLTDKAILLSYTLASIAPGYSLPQGMFIDNTGKRFNFTQVELSEGAPNKEAVDEIVDKLLTVAVQNLNLE